MRDGQGELVVFITAPEQGGVAERLARALVERKLAACVNIVPTVRSIYRWQGRIEDEAEALLIVKTRRDKLDELGRALKDLHPYEVPECIALAIERGRASFLDWLVAQTG